MTSQILKKDHIQYYFYNILSFAFCVLKVVRVFFIIGESSAPFSGGQLLQVLEAFIYVISLICFVRLVLVLKSYCNNAIDISMILYSHANKTHFHVKGFALSLVLKVRLSLSWNSEMVCVFTIKNLALMIKVD